MFLYLVHDPNSDLYKIGVTQNVKSRLRGLRVANPFLRLHTSIKFDAFFFPYFEMAVHWLFRSGRFKGEWFALSMDDISIIDGGFDSLVMALDVELLKCSEPPSWEILNGRALIMRR